MLRRKKQHNGNETASPLFIFEHRHRKKEQTKGRPQEDGAKLTNGGFIPHPIKTEDKDENNFPANCGSNSTYFWIGFAKLIRNTSTDQIPKLFCMTTF